MKDVPAIDSRSAKALALWQRATDTHDRLGVLEVETWALRLEIGAVLKDVRDGKFYTEFKFENVEHFAQDFYGFSKVTAYRCIQVVEQVVEKLPEDLVNRLTDGPNALPLKVLAGLQLSDSLLTPKELERLRNLPPEDLPAEIVKLGYNRAHMGGRGPSDVLRSRASPQRYRADHGKLLEERQANEDLREEVELFKRQNADIQERLIALEEATKGEPKKLMHLVSEQRARLAELEAADVERKAAEKAQLAGASDVLVLLGEHMALTNRLALVKIEKRQDWAMCCKAIGQMKDDLDSARGEIALRIQERFNRDELKEFDLEDPGSEGKSAEWGLTQPVK